MRANHAMRAVLALGLVGALALGCGEERTPVLPTSDTIGPSGGTVQVEGTPIALEVPAGALDQSVKISVQAGSTPTLPEGVVPGTVVTVGPAGVTFKKGVSLTIGYRQEDLLQSDTSWLRMVRLEAGKVAGVTQLKATQSGAMTLSALIPQTGDYAIADLKVAKATVSVTKEKNSNVDVLFVVDNSNSMEQEQKNLVQNFPKLMDVLLAEKLDMHVGVASTDLGAGNYNLPSCEQTGGDKGKLQNKARVAGCTPPRDAYISLVGGVSNVPGAGDEAQKAKDAFSCIAPLGTGGCGFEQTLEAARQALDPKASVNPGFVRKEAALAVVVISDEDDCSAKNPGLFDPTQQGMSDPLGPLTSFRCFEFGVTCDVNDRTTTGPRKNCAPSKGAYLHHVEDYVTFVKGLKPAGNTVVAAIAGPTDKVEVGTSSNNPVLTSSCQSSQGYAVPGIRLKAVVDAFGKNGTYHSICTTDFSPALKAVGNLVTTQTQLSWCLPMPAADVDPFTAGVQADCLVFGSKSGQIKPCTAQNKSGCFQLKASPGCSVSKAALSIVGATPAQIGNKVTVVCQVLK